jgi:sporulation protein YlmC with PRC-barrel domain
MIGDERPALAQKETAAMAEAEFAIGAEVSCSDGFCGKVSRLVIDPAARTVTHLVVEPGHRGERGRLVPAHLADATTGHIRLRCTIQEFGKLDPAEETEVVADAGYGEAGSVPRYVGAGGIGTGGPGYGVGVAMGRGKATPIVVNDVIPPGESDVRHGEHVHALDGEIGRVAGFLVDSGDQHVTHVLLQEGHLWGRKEVAIPISAVTAVDAGIRLNITKKQVEDLPPVTLSGADPQDLPDS